jgi:hypothetical protein
LGSMCPMMRDLPHTSYRERMADAEEIASDSRHR